MTRGEIEALIKRASDTMRADDNTKLVTKYIEHLSWLLFLKVYEAIEDEYALLDEAYVRILDGDYRWSVWAQKDWPAEELIEFVTNDLLPTLRAAHGSRAAELIATIFSGVTAVMKSGFGLKQVISIVDQFEFHAPQDVHTFSVIYESLLSRLGREGGWSGEFYTPRPIVRLMVEAVRPTGTERIYDPAAGSAGFLAEAFEFMKRGERTVEDFEHLRERTFFGQESGELPFLLGTMNLVLHGVSVPNIRRGNTLEQDVRGIAPERQFDVILTNPPFGGKENPQIQQNFPYRSTATELLFLQHVMAFLAPTGRAALVVPDGILFREDASFLRVRKRLVDDFGLRCIVRLPPGVFPYATATRTNLLFFDRGAPSEEIRYYAVAVPSGAAAFGKTRPIGDADVSGALAWIRDGIGDDRSWTVPTDDVRRGGYDLDLRLPGEAEPLDGSELTERLSNYADRVAELAEQVAALALVTTEHDQYRFSKIERLGDFVEKRGAKPNGDAPERFVGVTNTGGIAPFKGEASDDTRRYKKVEIGDFVYNPMRINVGSIGLCRFDADTGYASPEYVVFRLVDGAPFSSEYLLLYLQSAMGRHQIDRNAQGSVRARLYYENLRDVRVPVPEVPEAWETLLRSWRALVDLPQRGLPYLGVALDGLFRWHADTPGAGPTANVPEDGQLEFEGVAG